MSTVEIVGIGPIDPWLREALRRSIEEELGVECALSPAILDPAPAWHPERQQVHSSELLELLSAVEGRARRRVGLTAVDLFIPILTFVFGEATVSGCCAVVSYHRLRQEFYGLEPDDMLLAFRVAKEGIHELGHTLGLIHCEDYRCVMASSHSVEWIDLKELHYCTSCRSRALQEIAPAHRRRVFP